MTTPTINSINDPLPETPPQRSMLTSGPWPTVHDILTALVGGSAAVLAGLFVFALFGRYWLLAELVSSFRLQVSALLVGSSVALLLLRHIRSGFTLLGLGVGNLLLLAWVFLPSQQPDPGTETLTVMAMNVLCDNNEFEKVVGHVREVSPDVLFVIEYTNAWQNGLKPLHEAYPYRLLEPRWHGYGIAMLSKRPLESTKVLQMTNKQTDVPALVARVKVGDRSIQLAGLHTMSPTSRLRLNLRNEQMVEMARELANDDSPTMLIGDFNCTPWSPFFHDMLQICGYRDSRSGQGYLASWNTDAPTALRIPIDHAVVSRDIHVHHRRAGKPCGSDHLPTIIEISVAP